MARSEEHEVEDVNDKAFHEQAEMSVRRLWNRMTRLMICRLIRCVTRVLARMNWCFQCERKRGRERNIVSVLERDDGGPSRSDKRHQSRQVGLMLVLVDWIPSMRSRPRIPQRNLAYIIVRSKGRCTEARLITKGPTSSTTVACRQTPGSRG